METLKEIINILKIMGASIAGITFVVFMMKIAIEPEAKAKYLKLTKHLLIATILITLSLSLSELPQYYYGNKIEIVGEEKSETTIAELKDKDCQGRETVNIDGKWYVVTDKGTLRVQNENDSFVFDNFNVYIGYKEIYDACVLRRFSECQGTFKGYYAKIEYYRDCDGFIFPATYTYSEYIREKQANANKRR